MAARIQLAHAYRMLRRFNDAANVIREGQNLRPDVRYDQELSSIYYYQSLNDRQRNPNSLAEQFAALQAAYVAYPTNNYVAYRFVQALTGNSTEEAEFARSALQNLVDNKAPGQMATFLLGFDCLRRTLPTKAEDYFRVLRQQKPDGTPAVMAGLAMAVLSGQVRTVDNAAVNRVFEAGVRVWPNDPDLLMVQAQRSLLLQDYASALRDLNKALEARPKDAKLHEMVAGTYRLLGQVEQARKHEIEANKHRRNAAPAEP
jgi:predicted Zn-dependent protease